MSLDKQMAHPNSRCRNVYLDCCSQGTYCTCYEHPVTPDTHARKQLRSEDDLEIAYIRPPRYDDDPATGFATIFHVEDEVLADLDQIIVSGVYLKYRVDRSGYTPSAMSTTVGFPIVGLDLTSH